MSNILVSKTLRASEGDFGRMKVSLLEQLHADVVNEVIEARLKNGLTPLGEVVIAITAEQWCDTALPVDEPG